MIRIATQADEPAILSIWLTASKKAHLFLGEETLESQVDLIRDVYLPRSTTYIFEAEGRVKGFISLIDSYIGALFVQPETQGVGIGKALLRHCKTLYPALTVGVYQKNHQAAAFYLRNGFRQVGEERQQETGEWILNLLFQSLTEE